MPTTDSSRSSLSVALVAAAAMAMAACSGSPNVEEVVDRSVPKICEKYKECNAATFTAAFPGGVEECASKTKVEAKREYAGDLGKTSACTDAQLDKCLADLKAAACPAGGGLPRAPCKC
jgi:hypothetical protein